jgi:hypothetical protein
MFSVHGRLCVSCNQYISQSRVAAYESLCLICWRKVTKERRFDLLEKKRKRLFEESSLIEDRGKKDVGDGRGQLETVLSDERDVECLKIDDCPEAIEVFPGDPRPCIYSDDESMDDCPVGDDIGAKDEPRIGHFANVGGSRKQRHSSRDLLYSSRWTDFTNRLDSKYNNANKGQMDRDGGTDTTVMESDSMGGNWSDVDWENSSCSDGSLYDDKDGGSDSCESDSSDDLAWIEDDKDWDTCFNGDYLLKGGYEEEGGPIGFIRCMHCCREGLPFPRWIQSSVWLF